MASLAPFFNLQFFDSAGLPVAAGRLHTYDSGTTTPKQAWQDQAGTVTHALPTAGVPLSGITLDAAGRLPGTGALWLGSGEYTFHLYTSAGALVKTWDDVGSIEANLASTTESTGGDAMIGQKRTATGAVATTPHAWHEQQLMQLKADFSAAGDGVTSDATAIDSWKAAGNTLVAEPLTFLKTTATAFGNKNVRGAKGTKFKGGGITFASTAGNDFYDMKSEQFMVDGTGTTPSVGLDIAYAHRMAVDTVTVTMCSTGLRLNNAFTNLLTNGRFVSNTTYGALIEANSNASSAVSCSFNNNTGGTGCYVIGSYAVTFFGCDFEFNTTGLTLSNNIPAGSAENRFALVQGGYFEGNTGDDIWIGDNASADMVRHATIAHCMFNSSGGAKAVGIRVQKASDTKLLYNGFYGTYSTDPIYLRADSRSTTIIPFVAANVTVEAGATVSPQTIQSGSATVNTDGSGNGFADVTFAVVYDTATPTVLIHLYDTGDTTTAAGTHLVNNLAASGFRLRVVGGRASAAMVFKWRAGD